jgi:hypothetical protein
MKLRRILSLDGGGIRGLLTSRWLAGVDAALAAAGKPTIPQSFDLLAGSPSGGSGRARRDCSRTAHPRRATTAAESSTCWLTYSATPGSANAARRHWCRVTTP